MAHNILEKSFLIPYHILILEYVCSHRDDKKMCLIFKSGVGVLYCIISYMSAQHTAHMQTDTSPWINALLTLTLPCVSINIL